MDDFLCLIMLFNSVIGLQQSTKHDLIFPFSSSFLDAGRRFQMYSTKKMTLLSAKKSNTKTLKVEGKLNCKEKISLVHKTNIYIEFTKKSQNQKV